MTQYDCPHARLCPGCDLLEVSDREHDERKRLLVVEAFEGYGQHASATKVQPVLAAEPRTNYRTRAKLVVSKEAIGLYRRGTHEVVSNRGCLVLAPLLRDFLDTLSPSELAEAGVQGLDLRVVDEGFLLTLLCGSEPDLVRLEALRARFERQERLVGLAVSFRKSGQITLLGTQHRILSGPDAARHHLGPHPFHYATHGSFVQAHAASAGKLYSRVLALVGDAPVKQVLELHAGSGTLSLALAARGHNVTSVENYEPAVELARRAAREQNLSLEALAEDASTYLAKRVPYDVVLVNPPRRGLEPELRKGLFFSGASRLVYVSCDPNTLARDLAHLRLLGFEVRSIEPVDLMPLASTIETLMLLERTTPLPPNVLYEDGELLVVEKGTHESTHPQGDGLPSLLERLRLLPGAEAAVPVHRLDGETTGVCLFARRPEFVKALSECLSSGEKTYRALAKGITNKAGKIDKPVLEGRVRRPSFSRYTRLEVVQGHSLVSVLPRVGRRHQIRQHFRSIGHPLVGDRRYGDPKTNAHFFAKHGIDRTLLHCAKIELGGARTGQVFEVAEPADFRLLREVSKGRDEDERS